MKYKKALLIDDDDTSNYVNSWIIKHFFSENVININSAVEALSYLKEATKREDFPDVIFLDIRMPIMDGFEFLNEYGKLPQHLLDKCKVIVLSSSFDQRDHERALNNKLVYKYLNKPLRVESLEKV